MSQIELISYSGKKVVYVDLSGSKASELPPKIAEAKRLIASQPRASALILTNVTDVELTSQTSAIMKDFSTHNTPYAKASAVVGVEGLKKIIYSAVQRVSGRSIPTFDTIQQAKDWLVGQ